MILSTRSNRCTRCRTCCSMVTVVFLCQLTCYPQSSKSPAPSHSATIAVSTDLVVLPVRVLDKAGQFVSGLAADSFRVYENGQQQRVTLFQREDTPVTVGLIVDHSRSMAPKLSDVTEAIVAFAHSSNSEDEMFVVDFNDSVSLELPGGNPFTHDARELAKAVAAVSARGQTALYDAVNEGLHHLQLARGNKKALVIVSDGGDNASRHSYAEILALARRSQTVIYSIGLVGSSSDEENPGVLRRLSADTGGIAFFPAPSESVTQISQRIAHDLREQYTLGFSPAQTSNENAFRKIEVKVAAPGRGKVRVQTRRGYNQEWPAR